MSEFKYNYRRCCLILFKAIIIIIIILYNIRFLNSKEENRQALLFDFHKEFPLINDTFTLSKGRYFSKKNYTIILKNIEYAFSLKYNITEVKYQFYFNKNNNLIAPSNLTLLDKLQVFCNIENKNNKINVVSLSNIYENKYFIVLNILILMKN